MSSDCSVYNGSSKGLHDTFMRQVPSHLLPSLRADNAAEAHD